MKRFISLFLTAVMVVGVFTVSVAAASFPDVGEKNWCYSYVTDLADKGIVTGLPDGSYGPEQPVTRGSVAKLLWESLKYKEVALSTDSQITLVTGAWSAQYINDLASAGILVASEYPNGAFVENAAMSRLETIKAIVRAYQVANPTAKLPTASLTFTDASSIPVADHALVALGVDLGIINGITVEGGTKFAPNDPIQRSTVAAMISRFLTVLEKPIEVKPVDGPTITTVDGKEVEWLVAPTYEGDVTEFRYKFSDGMCGFEVDGKYGYINDRGDVVIQPTFTGSVQEFSYGYAVATGPDGQYGFIDKTGKWVVDPIYDWALPFSDNEGVVCGSVGYDNWWSEDSHGTFYDVNLNVIPERKFPGRDPDLDAIEKKYASSQYYVDEFNDVGLAAIYTPDPSGFSSNIYGVVNRSGKILVPVKYALATVYDDYIEVDEQMNYNNLNRMRCLIIDKTGKTVYEYYAGGGTHADDNAMTVRGYGEGLFSCRDEHGSIKDGYMLPDGTVVIEPMFDIAGDFSGGLAWVQYQGKWGIIKTPIK